MTNWVLTLPSSGDVGSRDAEPSACSCLARAGRPLAAAVLALSVFYGLFAAAAQQTAPPPRSLRDPLRVLQLKSPLAERRPTSSDLRRVPEPDIVYARTASSGTASTASWQPLGPAAVSTARYGLVTGRISSIAFDPADPTGNRVYIGTTGGGVWLSQNAATANVADVKFVPLTDVVAAMTTAHDASISIGAITVQPGATGVVLAGTGDTNDALDSYYGAGILRSTDGGNTWSLIPWTTGEPFDFTGEGFAGFAWSTVNPQLVVAAVSQAFDGVLANALHANASYEGLYYSTDGGATWLLARITDGGGSDVQGPLFAFALPDGNAATSVVWNPVRKLFIAAVRAHGYYQSPDGMTWTRLTTQPGAGLTTINCPTDSGTNGSPYCPIFRGALAVNPVTGDTFAWTTDGHNQDQGLWQDQCGLVAGVCTNQNLTFTTRRNTAALDTNDTQWGPATVEEGDYTLSLAAVPSGSDTLLLAGADDLWRCSLASGCVWRNTTNAQTCASARVAPYQHALAWRAANPLEVLIGNDSGLWRSLDAIGETGASCDPGDSTHFQNLNAGLGSLSEIGSMALAGSSVDAIMAGLGVNGSAGVKNSAGPTTDWPQVLGGFGGSVAIDPTNPSNWYVNNQAGVSIHVCTQGAACEPGDFGTAAITSSDVGGDGDALPNVAPFLIDPLDPSQLLIGTCRVWRGPANGSGWSGASAISPILDGSPSPNACKGDPFIRSMAAQARADGSEIVYVGMFGAIDGGGALAGHVFSAHVSPGSSTPPVWSDLTSNPVTGSRDRMNAYGLDVSSIVVDPHDTTGNTVYITIEGMAQAASTVRTMYRSKDGGATWQSMMSNLPQSPANAVVVDPQDAETVYIALDSGVFSTRRIDDCINAINACWSAYGNGLPQAPVTQLSAAANTLVAGTYGRGLWQIPLWTTGTQPTTVSLSPDSLTFPTQSLNSNSSAQSVTVSNTGATALTISSIVTSGDFNETDNCQNTAIGTGGSCAIQVSFSPAQSGTRTGQLAIAANVAGGQMTVDLNGTGASPTGVTLSPASVNFGAVTVGATSAPLQVTAENATSAVVPITSLVVPPPFVLSANACGPSLAANSDCQLSIEFMPAQSGAAAGTLTLSDGAGTQTVSLTGSGSAPPTDTLSLNALTFSGTVVGQISPAQAVSITNNGGTPLTSIATSVNGTFQVSSNCGTQLAANASCSFNVVYMPTATGAQTGVLTISDALRAQNVALAGTGLQPPQIGVSPTTLTFATQNIGTTGSPMAVSVSNTGGSPMANIGFQITGLSAGSFAIASSSCGALLINGSSCMAQVAFQPAMSGGASAVLTISSATISVKPVQMVLTGIGQAPAGINVTPPQMTLTAGTIGQPSAPQPVTIGNSSVVEAEGLTLAAAAPFSLSQNTCGMTLAAGATCTVGISFTPSANGAVGGMLTVTSTNLNSADVILTGIGGAAGSVEMQPSLLTFATTGVGTMSASQTIALSNSGPIDLAGLVLNVSSGFRLTNSTCTTTLLVGTSCTATIAFTPGSAGPQTGSLSVSSSAMGVPAQALLSGMGFDFALSVLGSSSQTVSSGQTASFTLVLAPANGTSGTFTFQCGSLPASAVCSFNPASEAVGGGTTGNVIVQIATGRTARFKPPQAGPGWGGRMALCGLFLLPCVLRRKRKTIGLAVLLLMLMCGVVSCSGSGGGTGGTAAGGQGSSGATAGTFSIPVDVAANGVSHTITLTMTVD